MSDSALQESARDGQIAMEYFIGLYSVLIWDALLCLNKERNRIWTADWGVLKILYLVVRYWSLIALGICMGLYTTVMPEETCRKIVKLEPAVCAIFTIAGEGILAVRCYAIWCKDTRILIVLIGLLCAEVGAMVAAITRFAPLDVFEGGYGSCIATSPAPGDVLTTIYWITPMCFDFVVTTLTFYQSWRLHKQGLRSRLFHTFVISQGAFFMMTLAVNLLNTIFYLQHNPNIQGVNSGPALCLTSIFACRLVLALRDEELRVSNTAIDARSFTTFQKNTLGDVPAPGEMKANYPLRHVVSVANDKEGSDTQTDLEQSLPSLDKGFSHPFAAMSHDGDSGVKGITIKIDKSIVSEQA